MRQQIIIVTILMFVASSILWKPLGVLIFSAAVVRSFIIMHDCGHGIYWKNKYLDYLTGLAAATVSLTSYSDWLNIHKKHHLHSNEIGYEQHNQTSPLTVNEFKKLDDWERFMYKLQFGKYSLFTITPTITFLSSLLNAKLYELVLIFIMLGLLIHKNGFIETWIGYSIAAVFGVTMFHLQHTFDGSYKEESESYDAQENALRGTSFIQMPFFLKWFTLNNEYHHIHHYNQTIPCYKLAEYHENNLEKFKNVKKTYFSDILTTYKWSLYDSDEKKFVDCLEL